VTRRGGRRHKQLLDEFKGTSGYWKLKEEELERPVWRTRFGRSYGPVVRQARVRMDVLRWPLTRPALVNGAARATSP
jgi:hypothetical protein